MVAIITPVKTKKSKGEISFPVLVPHKDRKKQTGKEKLAERDYEISCKFQTGVKIPDLISEYSLSRPQIYRIIKVHTDAAKQWTSSLPEDAIVVVNEMIARRAYENLNRIERLINTAEEQDDPASAAAISLKLSKCYHEYQQIMMNGATAQETVRLNKEVQRVINAGHIK